MSQSLQTSPNQEFSKIEKVLMQGDLTPLTEVERVNYYRQVCDSLGLNYLTKPFAYIKLNGKLVLYAAKDATDQLRMKHKISIVDVQKENVGDLYIVTVKAQSTDGRSDISSGALNIKDLKGENLANALMKAETKAKRRVTLSICGLGMLDETEVSDLKEVSPVIQPDEVKQINERFQAPKHEKLINAFAGMGVTQQDIENKLQKSLDDITPDDVDLLRSVFNQILSGQKKKEEIFLPNHAPQKSNSDEPF